eukprot:CAMPEP_0117026786 /NCGR_PEP_ID=MMETSP0472-20121206/19658_1 /TAXON_ID=693140 ORGANISM="Tiarina fusus, Strain LIS" /NCGR_SAMPLE_ID=MMETSP0472 /ASSEMBLY_ACC=CAM_ASM_000603 /LENGTH=299 /DNA_ID=CAMNT_0004733887 /DNA_START=16 /DNA_END=915 /DNA_ORIENTATION=+
MTTKSSRKTNRAMVGTTVFITGGSRGIGLAIALECAKNGCNVAIAAKTADPHPTLQGTIFTAAEEIEKAGGFALPIVCDIRFEDQVQAAVEKCVRTFGGLDILVNNASAIWPRPTLDTPMKKYDLMNTVNTRGTYMTSRICLPHLIASAKRKPGKQHILTISPPLNMNKEWFSAHVAYTIAKYGMSMCCLGMSEEFKGHGIGVNCLWPRTGIATAAVEWLGGQEMLDTCRKVEIMSEAAVAIIKRDSRYCTGNFFLDDNVLREEGVADFDKYAVKPGTPLLRDFFLDDEEDPNLINSKL